MPAARLQGLLDAFPTDSRIGSGWVREGRCLGLPSITVGPEKPLDTAIAALGSEMEVVALNFESTPRSADRARPGTALSDIPVQSTVLSIEPLVGEWDELASRVGATLFVRPGWVAAWWRAFGAGHLEIRTLRRNGRLVAVLPMARRFGALRSVTNYHTPRSGLLAEDWSAETELARTLFTGDPRLVSIAPLDPYGASMEACRQAAEKAGYRVVVRPFQRSPYMDIKGDMAEYESRLSRNLVADLHRSQQRLDRQGKVSVEIARGHERLEELLREAFAIEASGWKGSYNSAIQSRPETRGFYTDVARWAAARGLLRLFFLRLDQRPLAMLYALEEGGICNLLKGGYDPTCGRFSPGKLLMRAVVSHCFATGLSRLECHGDAETYKLRWAGAVDERKRFEAFSPSPAGLFAWAARVYGRPAAKRVLGLLGTWRRAGT
jgi:CelD/BcsL family acetyltransferase involved in cellulose biosynthesis